MRMLGAPLLLIMAGCATAPAPSPRVNICEVKEVGPARCGTLSIPEDRDKPHGRLINLYFVVLPAADPRADPIFVLQGGPGQAASTLADFYSRAFAASRKDRDIVLIDQRGTGRSNPLACDPAARGSDEELDLFPDAATCREKNDSAADVRLYTTARAVDDMELVRRALGYERINLFGTSYGTRVARSYAEKHPERVRSMILKGVVPAGFVVPTGFAGDTERAIRLLVDDCAADEQCRTAFPSLRRDYERVRERLASGDVTVTNEGAPVRITAGRAAALLRTLLQSTGSAADVPWLIHGAASDDWQPLAAALVRTRRAAATALFTGMLFAVACTEDLPLVDRQTFDTDARNTFLGSYWLDQLTKACRGWGGEKGPVRPPAVPLNTPTLLISGYLDPATPPRMAEEAARTLSNSRHLVIRYGSHSFTGLFGCVDGIMNAFVAHPEAAGTLNATCIETVRRPPWRTDGSPR